MRKSFISILFLLSLSGPSVSVMAGGIPMMGGDDILDALHIRACNAYLCLYGSSWPEELCQSSIDLYFGMIDMNGDQEAQRWLDSYHDQYLHVYSWQHNIDMRTTLTVVYDDYATTQKKE